MAKLGKRAKPIRSRDISLVVAWSLVSTSAPQLQSTIVGFSPNVFSTRRLENLQVTTSDC